jgi:hypothetical protein
MKWHILTRIGDADTYDPGLDDNDLRIDVGFLRPGNRWNVGNDALAVIEERAGNAPRPAAADLLYLAMSAYAADLRIPRRLAPDRWRRDLILHLPVQDLDLWEPCIALVERTLGFLTGDAWELRLRGRPGRRHVARRSKLDQVQAVSLFSGGLDSFVGVTDLLAEGRFLALVGHHGSGVTNSVQGRVLSAVTAKFRPSAAPFMLHAQPPKGKIEDGERTMRSRSILFFGMGIAVASALGGEQPLVVPENGLISLNVPLTSARTGSRSTRTTHPHYIALFGELLRMLGLPHRLETPYRFKTKGEMLSQARAPKLIRDVTAVTMSCSHPEMGRYRYRTVNNHCGYCVPCIIRRAATTTAGVPDTTYNVDVRATPPDHRTGEGSDYRAFQMAVERVRGITDTQAMFQVLRPGPLPPADARQFASTYLRGMEEVRRFLEDGHT